jgi:hypothetical protein
VISSATSGFDFVLLEISLTTFAIGPRAFTIHFGHSMREPVFGGATFGLAARGASAYRPEIDYFSHVTTPGSGFDNSSR